MRREALQLLYVEELHDEYYESLNSKQTQQPQPIQKIPQQNK